MDLTTATPAEIDSVLAELYGRLDAARADVQRLTKRAADYSKGLAKKAEGHFLYHSYTEDYLNQQLVGIYTAQEKVAAVREEMSPFEAEFSRRGGWSRAFLVDNTTGHVHNTMGCNTCFPTTQFAWLTDFSGHDEAEVVEAAGERACTVCFPSAPVDVLKRKSTIEAPARKTARLEREAKRAAAAAKKAAKAISAPDGEPLRVFDYHRPERRLVDGRVIPAADVMATIETLAAAKAYLTDHFQHLSFGWSGHPQENVGAVARAVAHKEGKDVATVVTEAEKRASKRR